MADENDGELTSGADIAAARAALLSDPPEIINTLEDAPAAPGEVDDTVLEDEVIDELTQPPAAGGEGAPAPAPAPAPAGTPDPYAAFGGEEAVRVAWQVQEALRTREGIQVLVANGLTALGYDANQIQEALAAYTPGAPEQQGPQAPAPGAPDPLAGLEDDDYVPASAVKALIAKASADAAAVAAAQVQAQVTPLNQAIADSRQQQVRNTTDAALAEVLGPIPTTDPAALSAYLENARQIEERGARYFDPQQWQNPNHIRQAVQHAHADLEAENEARFKAYLQTKKAARAAAPPNIGGGAGSDGPLPEPKSLAESRAQARAGGFFD